MGIEAGLLFDVYSEAERHFEASVAASCRSDARFDFVASRLPGVGDAARVCGLVYSFMWAQFLV